MDDNDDTRNGRRYHPFFFSSFFLQRVRHQGAIAEIYYGILFRLPRNSSVTTGQLPDVSLWYFHYLYLAHARVIRIDDWNRLS